MADFTVEGNLDGGNTEPVKARKKYRTRERSVESESVRSALKRWSDGDKKLEKLLKENLDKAHRLAMEASGDYENQLILETLAHFGINDPRKKKGSRNIYSFLASVNNQISGGGRSKKGVDKNRVFFPKEKGQPRQRIPLDVWGSVLGETTRGYSETIAAESDQDWEQKIFDFLEKNSTVPKILPKTDDAVYDVLYNMLGLDKYGKSEQNQGLVDTSEMSIEEQSLVETYGAKRRLKGQDLADWFESTLNEYKLDAESGWNTLPYMDEEAVMYYQDLINQLRGAKFSIDPAYLNPSLQEAYQGPEQEDIARNLEASLGIGLPPKEPPKPPTAVSPGDDEEDSGIKFLDETLKVLDESTEAVADKIEAVNEAFTETVKVVDDLSDIIEAKLIARFLDKNQTSAKGIEPVNEPFTPKDLVAKATGESNVVDSEEEPLFDIIRNALKRGGGRTGSKVAKAMDAYSIVRQFMGAAGGGGGPGGGGGGAGAGGAAGAAGGAGGAGGGGAAAAAGGGAAGGAAAGALAAAFPPAMIAMAVAQAIDVKLQAMKEYLGNRMDFAKDLAVGSIAEPSSVSPIGVSGEYFRSTAEGAAAATAGSVAGPVFEAIAVGVDSAVSFLENIDSGIQNLANELAPFSPDIIAADVEGQIARLRADMEQAQELGPLLAENVRARTEFELAIQDLGTTLTKVFGPLINDLIELATLLVKAVDTSIPFFVAALQGLLQLIGSYSLALKPFTDTAVAYLESIKNNTQPDQAPIEITELNDFLNPANTPIQGYASGPGGRMQLVANTLGVNF